MARINLTQPGALQVLADRIRKDLGVEYSFRGRELRIDWEAVPPRLYLPSMPAASGDDAKVLEGLAIRLAGHCKFTDPRSLNRIPDYVTKSVHVALQEDLVERKLEKEWPGSREAISSAISDVRAALKYEDPYRDQSWIGENGLARVRRMMSDAFSAGVCLDPSSKIQVGNIAFAFEARRCAGLWLDAQRGLDLIQSPFLLEWNDHPWRPIFDSLARDPMSGKLPRSTGEAVVHAQRIVEKLGIPYFPTGQKMSMKARTIAPFSDFRRPASRARDLLDIANMRRHEADIAKRSLKHVKKELAKEVLDRASQLPAVRDLEAAKEELDGAQMAYRDSHKTLAKARKTLAAKRRLERMVKKKLQLATKKLESEEKITRYREDLSWKEGMALEAAEAVEKHIREHGEAMDSRNAAKASVRHAKEQIEAQKAAITNEVHQANATDLLEAADAWKRAEERALEAMEKANELLEYISLRDEEVEQPVDTAEIVRKIYNRFKGPDGSRKYSVFSTEYDREVPVRTCSEGHDKYEAARQETEEVIKETKQALARLYSPVKTDIKANAKQGTLDPRHAYKVALAARGVPVSLQRIWTSIKSTKKPRVAVSILLDCSASMRRVDDVDLRGAMGEDGDPVLPIHDKDPEEYSEEEKRLGLALWVRGKKQRTFHAKAINHGLLGRGKTPLIAMRKLQEELTRNGPAKHRLARRTVVALAEVLRALNIPYEVLGHTTDSRAVPEMDLRGEDPEDDSSFSRFVPLVKYVFKSFSEAAPPVSVFTDVDFQDNIDGEALLWAAKRLAGRRERTKILVVVGDGAPRAAYSNEAELDHHMKDVCELLESREEKGLFLWGVGVNAPRTRGYFRNATSIKNVQMLPKAVMDAVKYILVKLRGTLA